MIKKPNNAGFTLIELLVVIAIIGVLSTIVLASLAKARRQAQYAKAYAEISQLVKAATIAQGESGKTLIEMTGNYDTDEDCEHDGSLDLRNISEYHNCYKDWIKAAQIIQDNTNGTYSNLTNFARDPWGSPYLLDENEGESKWIGEECENPDFIRSAGANGTIHPSNQPDNGDDIVFYIPFLYLKCP